ncbi:hypothetical protein [Streptomyces sp. NPDC094149]|uniref:hypothetical protein n=1 Tax=Streptomyces sp. NPDC094149 TaxID=3155079 RepID=UPI0033220B25
MSGEAEAGLRRDAVGLREVLFQGITAMAPAAAIAASIYLDEPAPTHPAQNGATHR